MKLLVIGGTRFVGRHFVSAALARGHELTLFNRGTQETLTQEQLDKANAIETATASAAAYGEMYEVLDKCKTVSGSDASIVWVDEEFLLQEKVAAWSELPVWLPESADTLKGFMFVSSDKAIRAGLTFRTLRETITDTLSWHRATRSDQSLKAGLDPEKERALLAKYER